MSPDNSDDLTSERPHNMPPTASGNAPSATETSVLMKKTHIIAIQSLGEDGFQHSC